MEKPRAADSVLALPPMAWALIPPLSPLSSHHAVEACSFLTWWELLQLHVTELQPQRLKERMPNRLLKGKGRHGVLASGSAGSRGSKEQPPPPHLSFSCPSAHGLLQRSSHSRKAC